jgi:hypothetical protein
MKASRDREKNMGRKQTPAQEVRGLKSSREVPEADRRDRLGCKALIAHSERLLRELLAETSPRGPVQ